MKFIIVCVTLASLAGSLSAELGSPVFGSLKNAPQPEDKSKVTLRIYEISERTDFKNIDPEMTVGEFKEIAHQYYEIPKDEFSLRTHRYYKDEEKIMDETKTLKYYLIRNSGSDYNNVISIVTDYKYLIRKVIIRLPDELKFRKLRSWLGDKHSLDLDVKWNTTIREIKEKLAEKLGVPVPKLKLDKDKFTPLSDDKILKDINMSNYGTLYLTIEK